MQNCKKPIEDEDGADHYFRRREDNYVLNSRPAEQPTCAKCQNRQIPQQSEEIR